MELLQHYRGLRDTRYCSDCFSCNYEFDNFLADLIYKGLFLHYISYYENTELCVMIKYYPLFILRSCLILIWAISKHSEEVKHRCELSIIKIKHFLTCLITRPTQAVEFRPSAENNISRIQISTGPLSASISSRPQVRKRFS